MLTNDLRDLVAHDERLAAAVFGGIPMAGACAEGARCAARAIGFRGGAAMDRLAELRGAVRHEVLDAFGTARGIVLERTRAWDPGPGRTGELSAAP